MLLRARFFDDWRLSRIDEEELERLSVNSDTSVAVDVTTHSAPSLQAVQRSASTEGVLLQSDDDDDSDEPPLPPPPSPLPPMATPPQTEKVAELDVEHQRRLDNEAEALRFLQVKYDSLGKIKVQRRQKLMSSQQQRASDGADETVPVAGLPFCQLNCNCSLSADSDEGPPRMAVGSDNSSQSLPSTQSSVTERRRRPPPPPTTKDHSRAECTCPKTTEPRVTDSMVDDHGHHHHHHQYHRQQNQLEQYAQQQRNPTTSCVCRQSGGLDAGVHSRTVAACICHTEQRRGASSSSSSVSQCRSALLSNAELFQIDLFYRSRRTLVHVCACPAVLYFARGGAGSSSSPTTWRFAAAGVPVLVADTIGASSSVGPRLHVVLAERGTGFELWRYGLIDVHQYVVSDPSTLGDGAAFHIATLPSKDVAGLCFDDADSAAEFHRQLLRLDELYSTGSGSSRSRKSKKSVAARRDATSGACDVIKGPI